MQLDVGDGGDDRTVVMATSRPAAQHGAGPPRLPGGLHEGQMSCAWWFGYCCGCVCET